MGVGRCRSWFGGVEGRMMSKMGWGLYDVEGVLDQR